jgi:hypothetical protein
MNKQQQPIGQHDLSTSAGGRAFLAEFFATHLRRHDFQRYIEERLAADFACALAGYLSEHDAAIAAGGAQETAAARDVLAERKRQVTAEGWTPEHDDAHDSGQLAGAASCYAAHVNGRQWVFFAGCADDYKSEPTPDYWPWDESWWKPTTPRRDLVKAGALILAEIERLDRVAASNGEQA